jgi:phosphatidylserine/phosphatidylglycerophosphate/cardiolipin synthase-like enzyme
VEQADQAAVVVDAADYFRLARQAMLEAQHQIILVGWDFDTRIRLDRGSSMPGVPNILGDFVHWLAGQKPQLEIYLLSWDMGALKLLGRGSSILTAARWAAHDRIHLKFDGAHPAGGTHHQKIVVIDDSFAFCGGIDMTARRWDTREHLDDDRRRRHPSGRLHGPWHDVTTAVDGEAARALGELARQRWQHATGKQLPSPPAVPIWPKELEPQFQNVAIGVARTIPATGEDIEIREIEALYLDLIASAKHSIYAENQYFASGVIADAIAKRLGEDDGPEFVLIMPDTADGWLEEEVMGSARARLMQSIAEVDRHRRFRIYTPVTAGGEPIYVHAKVMIVDGEVLRVGSSNWNNRSLGLDSECDVVIDRRPLSDASGENAIAEIRNDLLAEHLATSIGEVKTTLETTRSLIATIEQLRGSGKTLVPFEVPELNAAEKVLADKELLDPEKAGGFFEPLSKRGLFRRRRKLASPG